MRTIFYAILPGGKWHRMGNEKIRLYSHPNCLRIIFVGLHLVIQCDWIKQQQFLIHGNLIMIAKRDRPTSALRATATIINFDLFQLREMGMNTKKKLNEYRELY